jgi:hypothetical protein
LCGGDGDWIEYVSSCRIAVAFSTDGKKKRGESTQA